MQTIKVVRNMNVNGSGQTGTRIHMADWVSMWNYSQCRHPCTQRLFGPVISAGVKTSISGQTYLSRQSAWKEGKVNYRTVQ